MKTPEMGGQTPKEIEKNSIISDVTIRPHEAQNEQYWRWSLKVNDETYTNLCDTREGAEKMIEKYKQEIAEGVECFSTLLENADGDNEVKEIDPDDVTGDEMRNPTLELMRGLMKWAKRTSNPIVDKERCRISFDLHPEIWDGQLEFDLLRAKENWINYSYDQGGAL